MFLLCVVCWLSVAFSWPLTASPLDERMCCVNVSALLGIARLSEDEFEIVECESTVLTTLMNRTYGLVFGLESRLVARRKADEHSLVLTLFDETVTSRLSTSWESGVRRNGVVVCLYNVWHYTSPYRARLAKIAALLKEKDCDVILLQEVRMKWSFYGTSFLIDDLMRLMPASFSFAFTPGNRKVLCWFPVSEKNPKPWRTYRLILLRWKVSPFCRGFLCRLFALWSYQMQHQKILMMDIIEC
jgi:hypothetical protein